VTKIQADKIAVGIAGNTNSVDTVVKIIQAYRVQSPHPPFKPQNIMIWSIEPDSCEGKPATSQPNDVFFSNTGKWKDVLTELQSSSAESYNSDLTKFDSKWESFESPSSWAALSQPNRNGYSLDCV